MEKSFAQVCAILQQQIWVDMNWFDDFQGGFKGFTDEEIQQTKTSFEEISKTKTALFELMTSQHENKNIEGFYENFYIERKINCLYCALLFAISLIRSQREKKTWQEKTLQTHFASNSKSLSQTKHSTNWLL